MDDHRLRRIAEIEIALGLIADQVREAEAGCRPFPAPVPTGGFEAAEVRVRLIHRHLATLLRVLDAADSIRPTDDSAALHLPLDQRDRGAEVGGPRPLLGDQAHAVFVVSDNPGVHE